MEPTELEKQLLALKDSHKRVIVWGLIILLLTIALLLLFFKTPPVTNDLQVKALQDTIKVHDKKFLVEIQHLQTIHDSAIDAISEQQDNLQEQMTSLTNKYDKVRKQLNNSTVSNRLQFFSGHLPQTGAARK